MQVTGIQTAGARGFGSLTAAVVDTTPPASQVPAGSPELERAPTTTRPLHPEAVVFPRDGKSVDRRSVQLRRQKANERYREDGRAR